MHSSATAMSQGNVSALPLCCSKLNGRVPAAAARFYRAPVMQPGSAFRADVQPPVRVKADRRRVNPVPFHHPRKNSSARCSKCSAQYPLGSRSAEHCCSGLTSTRHFTAE